MTLKSCDLEVIIFRELMPKDTFLNLPDEKRSLIEKVAIEEFVTQGFDNASINRIVENCHIAKGSFYQYFEDKKDLYKHLIDCIGQEKMKYILPVLSNPGEMDFFTMIAALYKAGLEYGKADMNAALLANQLLKNKEHPVHKEILKDSKGMAEAFFGPLLQQAIDRGEIREDLDLNFIAYVLVAINLATLEYYYEVVRENNYDLTQLDDDVLDTVNLFLDFIKNGISKGKKE